MTSALQEVTGLAEPSADHADGPASSVAFDDWVAARGPALLRFAHLVTGNLADAQDSVQDALAGAYPRWQRLCERGQQEAYVRRSIVNGHVSRWRSLGRRELATEELPDAPAYTATEDHAEAQADADQAWLLCQSLPRRQRAAVVLRYYEDLSFGEIATILGCSEGTARSQVHRALAALRTRLEDETR